MSMNEQFLVFERPVFNSERNMPNGIPSLGLDSKILPEQLPASVVSGLRYLGTWNASTNKTDKNATVVDSSAFKDVNNNLSLVSTYPGYAIYDASAGVLGEWCGRVGDFFRVSMAGFGLPSTEIEFYANVTKLNGTITSVDTLKNFDPVAKSVSNVAFSSTMATLTLGSGAELPVLRDTNNAPTSVSALQIGMFVEVDNISWSNGTNPPSTTTISGMFKVTGFTARSSDGVTAASITIDLQISNFAGLGSKVLSPAGSVKAKVPTSLLISSQQWYPGDFIVRDPSGWSKVDNTDKLTQLGTLNLADSKSGNVRLTFGAFNEDLTNTERLKPDQLQVRCTTVKDSVPYDDVSISTSGRSFMTVASNKYKMQYDSASLLPSTVTSAVYKLEGRFYLPFNTKAINKLVFRDVECSNATFAIKLLKEDGKTDSQTIQTIDSGNGKMVTFGSIISDSFIKYTEPGYTVSIDASTTSASFDAYYLNYSIDVTVTAAGGFMTIGSMEAFIQVQ